ncbi:hypothetical protein PHYPSEUDO_014060 [Phytophthora pseudosyringae]|uniref:Uncharacterized protein n=1 Tax=Phytophthora pseudosyringae TaxID=221518 RepID=A0A8T1V7Z7_9STRA|nr:hypothetical protein PHYPSEUDO_014060 [Phytophthora pseudosyringae]
MQLLLLSAKFSMLKENDVVNEDADGNKNVQFSLGVKIRADRRAPDAIAPVYELKHIFQNKSHCAHAHDWEGVVEHPSSEPTRDVVVAFILQETQKLFVMCEEISGKVGLRTN